MTAPLRRRGSTRLAVTETQLLRRAQSGEADAFEELARPHVDRVFAIAVGLIGDRVEAEDVCQETLLRAWLGIGRFNGRSSFFTWLYRIAVNEASRSLRRGARRPQPTDLGERLQPGATSRDEPAHRAVDQELRAALRIALLALPLPQRTAIVLRDIQGLSTREAARAAGVGEAALKSRLHEARLKLRAALGDDGLTTPPSPVPTPSPILIPPKGSIQMPAVGLIVALEAKEGKEEELAEFLVSALPLVQQEPLTTAWFAVRLGSTRFAIFDAFPNEQGREAHLAGAVAAALTKRAPELLANAPSVETVDVLADKLPA
jgi:RNA polymerase sigma factor (sigma-70 family)